MPDTGYGWGMPFYSAGRAHTTTFEKKIIGIDGWRYLGEY